MTFWPRLLRALSSLMIAMAVLVTNTATADDVRVLKRGVLVIGFELSNFYPENEDGEWWVESDETTEWGGIRVLGDSRLAGARVEIEGFLSEPGQYGHLGSYSRKLKLTKVRLLKPLSEKQSLSAMGLDRK